MHTLNSIRLYSRFSLSLLLLWTCSKSHATTFYVVAGAVGNGTSWYSPLGDLQKALHRASYGDEIWVAKGTYYPTSLNNRSESFMVPRGVKLYGGFEGTEQGTNTRNWEKNQTILSGNIGTHDESDNSYNVLTIRGADDQTVIDGFIIQDGNANGDRMGGAEVRNIGGGLINEGWKGKPSTPQILHCVFRNNIAKDGGAVYNNGRAGNASITFIDCTFESNEAILDGGAVYNDGRQGGKANSSFKGCHFIGNKGNYGGAVSNYGVGGQAEPLFSNCYFSENTAYMKGGAIYSISSTVLELQDYKSVIFSNNSALDHDSDNVNHHLVTTDKNNAPRL